MIKIIYPDEQDESVKVAGQLSAYFEDDGVSMKKAASSTFSDKMIRDNAPDKNHFGIHFIALGSGEDFGANRNGDHFEEAGLKRKHHTFVKNGHFFREHKNSSAQFAIGTIKASGYNDEMHRVEVIVHGDKEKANDVYELMKSGKDVDCSMSCRVPWDRCSCCGQKSASSKSYCSHLKYHMNQWLPQFSKFAYAENPDPTFFDLSKVANRADRIARHLEFISNPEDELKKAASAPPFIFSDERATVAGILIPDEFKQLGCANINKQRWLEKLAAAEKMIQDPTCQIAQHQMFDVNDLSEDQMAKINKIHSGVLFRKLASKSIVLPLLPFVAYITRQNLKQASENPVYMGASALMPTLFQRMLEMEANTELEAALMPASLFKEAKFAPDNDFNKMLGQLDNDFSVDPGTARIRIMRISITTSPRSAEEKGNKKTDLEKKASALTDAQRNEALKIARAYGLYKIGCCEEMAAQQKDVDDTTLLLVASQHIN